MCEAFLNREFGLYGMVGGMMVIELLAYIMSLLRRGCLSDE